MFLLHEAHRLAQELQYLEPLGRRYAIGIQLIELCEETNVRWADVDERQGLQPLRAAGRIREIGSGGRLDTRGIEARHGVSPVCASARLRVRRGREPGAAGHPRAQARPRSAGENGDRADGAESRASADGP